MTKKSTRTSRDLNRLLEFQQEMLTNSQVPLKTLTTLPCLLEVYHLLLQVSRSKTQEISLRERIHQPSCKLASVLRLGNSSVKLVEQ